MKKNKEQVQLSKLVFTQSWEDPECDHKALKIRLEHLGNKNPDVGVLYNNVANGYIENGSYTLALEYLYKALELYKLPNFC